MTDEKNEADSGASRSDAVLAANSRYEIWDMRHEIDQARTDKQREVMAEYDRDVYYPAKKKLYALCEERGHRPGPIHNNGLGWTFIYCSLCGGIIEKHGPDGA